ncbi:autotransporter domain-containing protein [Pseudolabrys taiwanensis]|uniref:Autotransporter domain-containing protein n=1 Tax=Pseudolabrys taiwanensis TaxID=331696 RepID=A0A345ZZF8_9HYPH|nr:autotransporter domain-containing protein [Pseudolabrys taiwanensis]AXK82305.1 autotransporter domain-containing protein [Pseudolabrys taiwanensis]
MRCRSKAEGRAGPDAAARRDNAKIAAVGASLRGRITPNGLYNYHALAGHGSDTFRGLNEGRSWRAALLGTVATGALWMMTPRPAKAGPAACTIAGTTATCTGDQSGGVSSTTDFNGATVDTLNVNSLTTNITPAAGTAGILFFRYGASDTVTINSNVAPHSISAVTLPGITASAYGGVTINNTGDIHSIGAGISALSLNGGAGGTITIINRGAITASSFGILASGDAGVTVQQTGDLTSGSNSNGIRATSSNGPVSVTNLGNLTAGAFGISAKSDVGTVYVNNSGNITSGGLNASSIYARGVLDATVRNDGNLTSNSPTGRGIFAYSSTGVVTVTSSGTISGGGDGIYAHGAHGVTVQHTGDITTTHAGTGTGIRAFSGSGAVNVGIIGNISTDNDGIYARAAGGAATGNVTVSSAGNIASAHGRGIYANAASGTAVSVTSTGAIAAFGDGIFARNSFNNASASVAVTHTGDITSATGRGIYANAASGSSAVVTSSGNITAQGNGIDARATGGGGDVTVTHTGDIRSNGASGIYARAFGTADITVNGGTISGATAGIQTAFSMSNITISSGATVTGGTAAILGGGGGDTVNNSGIITGDVDLGSGVNIFNNLSGGLFNSGSTVNVGAGNALTNSGTLAPGGVGTLQTTTLTGNFVQNVGGTFAVDVNATGMTSDRLNVSGTAQLAGTVVPHFLNMSMNSMSQAFTIVSAAGGTADNGLTVHDTAVMKFQLLYPNPTDVQLNVLAVNFAPPGMTQNQQMVGDNLQQAFVAGGGSLGSMLTYLAGLDHGAFVNGLDRLTPEAYLAQSQAALWSSFSFANSLFSCPLSSSQASLMGEGNCYWLRPSGHVATFGGHDGYSGFKESAAGLTGGVQGEFAPNWYLDAGAGYERSSIDTDTSSANGNIFHGGAALKYIRDNWLVAGSVSGSLARYDTSRYGIPTAGTAAGNADTGTLDLRLRFAYAFGTLAFYVKPHIDFDAVGLWRGGINESGAGALNLNVRSQNDWVLSAAPAVEIGTQWQQDGYTWRPYVQAGVRFLNKDDFRATASFEGAPASIAPFTVTSPLDQALAEVSAGFDVWKGKNLSLRVSYDGRFSSHSSSNGGSLEARAAF